MRETHFAYKIVKESATLVCSQFEFESDKMIEVLKEIQKTQSKGIYWIFKQLSGKPQEALCIIDCAHNRIYYHYSGEVEAIDQTIQRLDR